MNWKGEDNRGFEACNNQKNVATPPSHLQKDELFAGNPPRVSSVAPSTQRTKIVSMDYFLITQSLL